MSPEELALAKVISHRQADARPRISKKALAERAGISTSTISRKLNGKRSLTVGELHRIAEVLGTSARELFQEAEKDLQRERGEKV